MQIAKRRKDFQHVRDRFGHRQPVALATFERLPTDVFHDDVTHGFAMLVGVLDEVEDLHDRGVDNLGEEPPLGHRDGLCFGVTGMHQAFEHHRAIVDVAVERQINPAQSAVRDAALDDVLAGNDGTRIQLRQERIGASAVRAPALRLRLGFLAGSADRPSTVPAEPFGFRHNRIGHQRFERVDVGLPRDFYESTAQPSHRSPRRRLHPLPRRGIGAAQGGVIVIVEVGPEDRLGG